MKTKLLILFTLLLLNSCSLFQLECENGYKYELTCIFIENNVDVQYHQMAIFYSELLQPEEVIQERGLAGRCVENGAVRVFITVYKQYCNTTAHEPIYKTSIKIQ